MPRTARLRLPGYPHHVTQRGVDGMACFRLAADRRRYLALIEEHAAPFGVRMHAFVLMTNHVHLLYTPERPESCWLFMQRVGQRYAQYFNARHHRTGPLWGGRFHSSVVDSDSYLFRCQRYVELNPVRAGMVRDPRDYPWSSFRSNAFGIPSTLLQPHEVIRPPGCDPGKHARDYLTFFELPIPPGELELIRSATHRCVPIGSKAFVERLEADTGLRLARRRYLGNGSTGA